MCKIIMLSVALILACKIVYAHPPSDIEASYDDSTCKLDITVTHHVSNPQGHFIKDIEISLNGIQLDDEQFQSQYDNDVQKTVCEIKGAKPGDRVTIKATCSIYGSLAKDIVIE